MTRKGNRDADDAIVIKKYANRRLYNTATSSYVTLDHLARMVKDGVDFVVYDARTGEDITRSVLTQIIVEEEAKGANLLPLGFLRQLIGFYGDSLQTFVPRYLEMSMENLARNREQLRDAMARTFGPMFPTPGDRAGGAVKDMVENNMAMFQSAMEMFYPGGANGSGEAGGASSRPAGDDARRDDIDALRSQIDSLRRQVDELAKRG